MAFDPELLKALVNTFKVELEEQLLVITNGLLLIEKEGGQTSERQKIIESIFRSAHNIKGAARSLNINDVSEIAHHIESLFAAIQKDKFTITEVGVDLCLEAVDKIRLAMKAFLNKATLPFDLSEFIDRLEQQTVKLNPIPSPTQNAAPVKPKDETSPTKNRKPKTPSPKETIQAPHVTPPQSPSPFLGDKKEKKQIFSEKNNDEDVKVESVRVSVEHLDRIGAIMEEMQVNKIAIEDRFNLLKTIVEKMKQLILFSEQGQISGKMLSQAEQAEHFQKLFHLTYESVKEKNESLGQLHKDMHLRFNELTNLFHALQEEIHTLRLVPAASLLQTFPRLVRDLARDMGKKVELIIKDNDVKLDKMVLQGLKDPLIHLLRNAIDHGIEAPESRKAQGKSEVGHIRLEIHEEGNQISISIRDDGGGIDVNRVATIALNKNLLQLSERENMSEEELLHLIFCPGFTTKEIITDISGRGVGLDVVKENLTNLKGQVSVVTEPLQSTTFYLRVPLTLASERGLIVISGGQSFVIPTDSIERVLLLRADELIEIEACQAILLNGHPIPLRTLSDILHMEKRTFLSTQRLPVMVLQKGLQVVALLVDEIVGEREIVVKPLHAPLNNIAGIAGGTLAGNGDVIVVLNPQDLVTMTLQKGGHSPITMPGSKAQGGEMPHILVVDDSITTRTLEKSILESKGYQVTVAVDGSEAWDFLQKQTYALLITDVVMPIVDGFTLTERVKKTESLQNMPVIIVTSLGSDAEKQRGIDVGADAYIIKNEFESGALLEIVGQLV